MQEFETGSTPSTVWPVLAGNLMKPPHNGARALLVLLAAFLLVEFGIDFRGQAALGQTAFAPEVRAASDVAPPVLLRGAIINWAPRSEPLRFEPAEASAIRSRSVW
jgi:hypothetical protein